MKRRSFSLLVASAMVASAFVTGTADAQEAPPTTVPEVVQIEDPAGDSNFLNDQDNAYGTPLEGEGDRTSPTDLTVTDFLKIWFSNTADTVSVHVLTEAPPPASNDVYLRVSSNPGEGAAGSDTTRGCISWIALVNGSEASVYQGDDFAFIEDACNVGDDKPLDVEIKIEELADGTGVTTMTAPRSFSPLFADGGTIGEPYAIARVLITTGRPGDDAFASAATTDTTKRGSEYVIVTESDDPPPGKKKGCDKGKGKKRGCKKKGEKEPDPGPPAPRFVF